MNNIIRTFLLVGIILGPCFSVAMALQSSTNSNISYQSYELPYYYYGNVLQSVKKPQFVTDTQTYIVNYTINSISIYNDSIFIFAVSQTNKFELLEINMTSDFQSIISSRVYLLPNFSVFNFTTYFLSYPNSNQTNFFRPIFDGTKFWTLTHEARPINDLFNVTYSVVSFTKSGSILTKHSLPLEPDLVTSSDWLTINFLGIYRNNFFIEDESNQRLDIFSALNYTELYSIPLGSLITNDFNFAMSPSYESQNIINLDTDGYLWFGTQTYYIVAISLQDILTHQSSNIVKTVKVNDFENIWTAPYNLLDFVHPYYIDNLNTQAANGTFHGLPVDALGWQDTSIYAYKNDLIYAQFLSLTRYSFSNPYSAVFTGISVNKFSQNPPAEKDPNGYPYTNPYTTITPENNQSQVPYMIFLNLIGYFILIADVIVIYKSKKN